MKIFSPKINQKLTAVKVVYWAMLIYMIAALFWWFIALVKQNDTLIAVQLQQIAQKPGNTVVPKQTADQLLKMQSRKRVQYMAEGLTFLALIFVGAVYVYRDYPKRHGDRFLPQKAKEQQWYICSPQTGVPARTCGQSKMLCNATINEVDIGLKK